MNTFIDFLMFFVLVITIITALSIKSFFLALNETVQPTISEYGNILLLHIILTGLIWGWTDRTLTSFFIVVVLCMYLTFGISIFILAKIRYIKELEKEILEDKE